MVEGTGPVGKSDPLPCFIIPNALVDRAASLTTLLAQLRPQAGGEEERSDTYGSRLRAHDGFLKIKINTLEPH